MATFISPKVYLLLAFFTFNTNRVLKHGEMTVFLLHMEGHLAVGR